MAVKLKARILRRHGIAYPFRTILAARRAGLDLPTACAVLDKETSGGRNVFGHDPVDCAHPPYQKGGAVSRSSYRAYKRTREVCGMQGVGPTQLTWMGFQDEADRLGGCWRPYINMLVGFRDLAHLIRSYGRVAGIARYNGTGSAAEEYSSWVRERAQLWRARLT